MKLSGGSHASAMGRGLAVVAAPLGGASLSQFSPQQPHLHVTDVSSLSPQLIPFLAFSALVALLFQFCFKASTAAVHTQP